MGAEPVALHALVNEIKQVGADIADSDARMKGRVDSVEKSVNELFKRVSRPGQERVFDDGAADAAPETGCRALNERTGGRLSASPLVPLAVGGEACRRKILGHGGPDRGFRCQERTLLHSRATSKLFSFN